MADEDPGRRINLYSKNDEKKPAYSQSMIAAIFSVFGFTMTLCCERSLWQKTNSSSSETGIGIPLVLRRTESSSVRYSELTAWTAYLGRSQGV